MRDPQVRRDLFFSATGGTSSGSGDSAIEAPQILVQ
jgi:hypothetical protein